MGITVNKKTPSGVILGGVLFFLVWASALDRSEKLHQDRLLCMIIEPILITRKIKLINITFVVIIGNNIRFLRGNYCRALHYSPVVFRFTKLPSPIRVNPIRSMFIGSENDLLKISVACEIPAVALTQNSDTDTTPTICKINRLTFFIIASM